MKKLYLVTVVLSFLVYGEIAPYNMASLPHLSAPKHIRLIDQKSLDIKKVGGIPFAEISDLAYDAKSRMLYMLSDKGRLFAFGAKFDGNSMNLKPISGHYLHKKGIKKLKPSQRDSEGLTLDNKNRLWVSFEGKPRIAHIDKNGTLIRQANLPSAIPQLKYLRSPNKGPESLTWHPRYGLITALEYPQKGISLSHQTLYGTDGQKWEFVIPDIYHPAVTAIETMHDGNILVLMRSFDKKHFRVVVALIKVYLDDKDQHGICRSEVLARFSTDDGWALDNFEGLTRVSPHRYLMVSDNGNDFFRKTLLIYFQIKD